MNRGRGIVAGALFALVLTLVVAMQFLEAPAQGVPGSTASSAPNGRKALARLLSDVGFDARPWSDVPAALPRRTALVWLAGPPRAHIEDPEPNDPRRTTPPAIGAHALEHYRRFVEDGGTLLLADGDDARAFLDDAFGEDLSEPFEAAETLADELWSVRVSTGEVLEIDAGSAETFVESALPLDARVVATARRGDGTEAPIAVALERGSGSVVLLWSDAFLANEAIGEHDHAVLAVRLAEVLAPSDGVLFDEYALGLWSPAGVSSVALGPTLFLATAHGLLLLLAFVWFHAAPRAFPRDPEPLDLASPLLRVRARASLLERARRHDLLAAMLRRGVATRLARGIGRPVERADARAGGRDAADARARLPRDLGAAGHAAEASGGAGVPPIDASTARRELAPVGERELAEIAARTGADLASVRELFVTRGVAAPADLEELARDLALLERAARARR